MFGTTGETRNCTRKMPFYNTTGPGQRVKLYMGADLDAAGTSKLSTGNSAPVANNLLVQTTRYSSALRSSMEQC